MGTLKDGCGAVTGGGRVKEQERMKTGMPFWVAVTCLAGGEVNQVSLVIGLRISEGYIVRPTGSRKTDLHPRAPK